MTRSRFIAAIFAVLGAGVAAACTARGAGDSTVTAVSEQAFGAADGGVAAEWRQHSGPGPAPRTGHAMAFDSRRSRIVLFGGEDAAGRVLDDTWEWDGSGWTERVIAHRPPASAGHAMAYDSRRGRTIFVPSSLLETWQWDGVKWSQLQHSMPAAGLLIDDASMAMAYDESTDIVLCTVSTRGAFRNPIVGQTVDELLTFGMDDEGWFFTQHADMRPRSGFTTTYDPVRRRVVLFGGETTSTQDDMLEWADTAWTRTQLPTNPAPLARAGHGMTFAQAYGELVMFGGMAGPMATSETWSWNGRRWSQLPNGPAPQARKGMALATDAHGRVIGFGGRTAAGLVGDTWILDKGLSNGGACQGTADCQSGHCVDGVCCDTACGGVCEACNGEAKGTCSPIVGPPVHGRCTGDGLCAGQCGGRDRTACMPAAAGTSCSPETCTAASTLQAASCDGSGRCARREFSCEPYACESNRCRATCEVDDHCGSGSRCDRKSHTCRTATPTCTSDHAVGDTTGTLQDCAPYRCDEGKCRTECSSVAHCLAPSVCDSTGRCVPPPTAQHGACSMAPNADPDLHAGLLMGAVALVGRRRRVRRAPAQR